MENVELHQLALRSEILGVVSEFSVEEIEAKTVEIIYRKYSTCNK